MIKKQQLTVERLRALLRRVAVPVAVAALHLGHVSRLRTLTAHMAFLIAVAADDLARRGAITRLVTLLAAVVASAATTTAGRAVLGEVAGCHDVSIVFHQLRKSLEQGGDG